MFDIEIILVVEYSNLFVLLRICTISTGILILLHVHF